MSIMHRDESFANLLSSTGARSINRDVSYSEVAAATLLTWDILVSLSDEVQFIWGRSWTLAKIVYLALRYVPWVFQLALLPLNVNGTTGLYFTPLDCETWMIVQAVMLQITITTVDIILIGRIYVLYNKSVKLLCCLGAGFAVEIAFLCYVLSVVTPKLTFDDNCFVTSSPSFFVAYWIASLTFETLLFLLTLLKFAEAVRQGWGRKSIMQQFVADGTWVYTLLFVTLLVNMLLYKYVHTSFDGICFTWLLSVVSLSGSRLVLHPRRRRAIEDTLSFELSVLPSPQSPAVLVFDPRRKSFK